MNPFSALSVPLKRKCPKRLPGIPKKAKIDLSDPAKSPGLPLRKLELELAEAHSLLSAKIQEADFLRAELALYCMSAPMDARKVKAWMIWARTASQRLALLSLAIVREICGYLADQEFVEVRSHDLKVHSAVNFSNQRIVHYLDGFSIPNGDWVYLCIDSTRVFICGSLSGGSSRKAALLHVKEDFCECESLTSLYRQREAPGLLYHKKSVYVFGGIGSQPNFTSKPHFCSERLNLDTPTSWWRLNARMRYPHSGFTPCEWRDRAYLCTNSVVKDDLRCVEVMNLPMDRFEDSLFVKLPSESVVVAAIVNNHLLLLTKRLMAKVSLIDPRKFHCIDLKEVCLKRAITNPVVCGECVMWAETGKIWRFNFAKRPLVLTERELSA